MAQPEAGRWQFGWDIGGAHVKACLLADGALQDIAQWPCPLWQGMEHLDAALQAARARWPGAWGIAHHAATMTGEMVDLFPDRAQGVARIAIHLAEALGPALRWFGAEGGWHAPHEAARHWRGIASANWCATARALAPLLGNAVLVDIGSTTSDLIALRGGRMAAQAQDDAGRLATGELVYQGVVRTPLCALAPRVRWQERSVNVMNEFFATTADVYRLTGELDPAHDQAASADGRGKDAQATQQRLARMVGRDAADAAPAEWLALANGWKEAQLAELQSQLERVCTQAGLDAEAPLVGAGCGAFLAAQLARRTRRPFLRFADVALRTRPSDATLAAWADVCAPAVAIALLAGED